jgi:hypothetical protein
MTSDLNFLMFKCGHDNKLPENDAIGIEWSNKELPPDACAVRTGLNQCGHLAVHVPMPLVAHLHPELP